MLTLPAVNRACELVEQLGAGEVLDGVIDIINYVPEPFALPLEPDRINALLGTEIPEADMIDYLRREQIPVVDGMIQVPSWRPDLRRMADIAEEVARFYGYNEIPTTLMRGATTRGGYSPAQKLENQAGAAARALGYSEIITYSFVSPSGMDQIRAPKDDPRRNQIKLLNPLGEDSSVMRTTGIPSMLDILAQLNVLPLSFEAVKDNPSFHPGRCAAVSVGGKRIGLLGQIHPLAAKNFGMDCEVYLAELNFTELMTVLAPEKTFTALPRFPAVSRDLAVACAEEVTVGALEACITKAAGKLLREIKLFDVYRGAGILPGMKSAAFSLSFRAEDRTLTDADIEPAMNKVLKALENEYNAVRR